MKCSAESCENKAVTVSELYINYPHLCEKLPEFRSSHHEFNIGACRKHTHIGYPGDGDFREENTGISVRAVLFDAHPEAAPVYTATIRQEWNA